MATTPWYRVWSGMQNDPKWRTIARLSQQRIGDVIAVFIHVLDCASNATERGRTENLNPEDIASALDLDTSQVEAILAAMQGRVLDGVAVAAWEKRQPVREDGSAERSKAWREEQKAKKERSEQSANASERSKTPREDKRREETSPNGDEDTSTRAAAGKAEYPPEFEAAWQAYPDRPGDSKANAHKAWAARRKGGVTAEVLLAGAQRYAAFCTASATEPQYVKQAATFFGPGEHYLADWTPVARSQPAANQPRRDARDAWLSGIGSTITPGDQHAEPDQRTVDVEARFVG